MTEEEYFRKHYPDFCYGDKPLSPYWDFFQDGVEFGERQSEKKIEELEQENAILKGRTEGFEKQILGLLYKYESVYKRFPDLKDAMNEAERVLKENAELKEKLNIRSCQNCKHSKKSCPNDGSCKQYSKWEGYENPQLTKAKEVIKSSVVLLTKSRTALDTKTYLMKAEKFIKEIKK